ncbi:MAG: hypothetical protein QF699_03045, partial [Candidatus Poseidoniaceae archaeon]|nr:hypothetical protein [Candidatus Poseidoniaceae archaeon]
MADHLAPSRRSNGLWVLVLAIGLLQMPIMVQGMVVDPSQSLTDGMETNLRGQSVLIEELT